MFGLPTSIVADIISPVGVLLQKIAHQRDQRPVWRSPTWWAGLAIVVGAEIGNGVAYGDADVATSAITAVGCVGIVSNAVISRVVLKERASRANLGGAALVVVGVVQVIAFSPRGAEPAEPNRPIAAATIALLVGVFAIAVVVARRRRAKPEESTVWLVASAAAGGLGVVAARYAFLQIVRGVDLSRADMWRDWAFYVAWVGIVTEGIAQLFTFNKALALSDTRVVVPLFYVLYTLVASTSSSIVYGEFRRGSVIEWVLFADSLLICSGGVVLLLLQETTRSTPSAVPSVVVEPNRS